MLSGERDRKVKVERVIDRVSLAEKGTLERCVS